MRRRCRAIAAAAIIAVAVAGCGETKKPVYEEKSVAQLYNAGLDELSAGNYIEAAKQFEEVERQHPFSIWSPRAQIMGAYAYFEADNYDDAIINIDRFIQLHPNHVDAPYAYYLKALAYYEQIVDVERDQATTLKALEALDDVYRRFPDSVYARDAQLKRDLAFDHLAGKDMSIGRYYLRSGKPLAAINRFRSVLRNYQTTSHTPEALHRLVEAYTALGLKQEAERTAAVLGYNFPGSRWYADSYYLLTGERVVVNPQVEDRDWIERSWDYLFIPRHAIGIVDEDAEPERKQDLILPPEDTGPTVATLGGAPVPDAQSDTAIETPAAAAAAAGASATAQATRSGITPQQPTAADNAANIAAQLEAADSQYATANASATGWRQAANAAANPATRQRALENVQIAESAADYWQARANLLRLAANDPGNVGAKRTVEQQVAKSALVYWRTVERLGESQTERTLAAQNAAEAEQALAYWDDQGRGWLGRLFGGRS